jgi:hypothetical protein
VLPDSEHAEEERNRNDDDDYSQRLNSICCEFTHSRMLLHANNLALIELRRLTPAPEDFNSDKA